jgi:hypothetical protein
VIRATKATKWNRIEKERSLPITSHSNKIIAQNIFGV